jgi:hypothetical protein
MENIPSYITSQFKKENLPYIRYGLTKEQELEQFIMEKYGKDLKKQSHYSTFDWIGEKVNVELKNRNCRYNTYPTTMVGYNKIKEGLEDQRDCYFLFSFNDGSLYEWRLDKSKEYLPEKRELTKKRGYTTYNQNKDNYYLPITELVRIIPPNICDRQVKPLSQGCLINI